MQLISGMTATHVHTGFTSRWPQTKQRPAVQRAPRRQAKRHARQWTRLFFHGEPQPWHAWAAVFGLVTVGLYLAGIMLLPFLLG